MQGIVGGKSESFPGYLFPAETLFTLVHKLRTSGVLKGKTPKQTFEY